MTDGPIPNAYRPDERYDEQFTYVRAPQAGSPRWLASTRDVVIIAVGLLIIVTAVLLAVEARNAGNALDGITNPTPTSSPVPPYCYIDPNDPSCPPGFTPGGG